MLDSLLEGYWMPVRAEKLLALQTRMAALGLQERDLQEQFVLSSGRGGQKAQKTHNCVVLKHIPSGLVVKCDRERSREINRYLARRLLADAFERRLHHPLSLPKNLSECSKPT